MHVHQRCVCSLWYMVIAEQSRTDVCLRITVLCWCSACIECILSLAEVSKALLLGFASTFGNGTVMSLDPRLLSWMPYKFVACVML